MKTNLNEVAEANTDIVQPVGNRINVAELTPVPNRYLSQGVFTPLSNLKTPLSDNTIVKPQ